MPSVVVLNQLGAEVGKINLKKEVFGIEPNTQVVYDVVNAERAGKRQGTHDTKGRSEVSGGGRKPWRQKGTGRARQGSIRAPQWRGGGVVFGPTPRSYEVKVNRKVHQLAVKSILSSRVATKDFRVLDLLDLEDYKTKTLVNVLKNIDVKGKILVILEEENPHAFIAGANIPNVYVQTKAHVSVYDLINADMLVMTKAVVKKYEEDLE